MENEIANSETELHTEQMQDIIGRPPGWLYRWGITLVLIVAVICIIISSLISYPETVQSRIKMHLVRTPAVLSLTDSALLMKIMVPNNSSVKHGDNLALIKDKRGMTIIKAPADGVLNYAGVIHENEHLSAKQNIYIITAGNVDYYGEMSIPQNSLFKIKTGQAVMIKLRGITDEQWVTKGKIKYITNDQLNTGSFVAEVDLEKNSKLIPYSLLRNGTIADAEIITNNATLLNRLIKNLTQWAK